MRKVKPKGRCRECASFTAYRDGGLCKATGRRTTRGDRCAAFAEARAKGR